MRFFIFNKISLFKKKQSIFFLNKAGYLNSTVLFFRSSFLYIINKQIRLGKFRLKFMKNAVLREFIFGTRQNAIQYDDVDKILTMFFRGYNAVDLPLENSLDFYKKLRGFQKAYIQNRGIKNLSKSVKITKKYSRVVNKRFRGLNKVTDDFKALKLKNESTNKAKKKFFKKSRFVYNYKYKRGLIKTKQKLGIPLTSEEKEERKGKKKIILNYSNFYFYLLFNWSKGMSFYFVKKKSLKHLLDIKYELNYLVFFRPLLKSFKMKPKYYKSVSAVRWIKKIRQRLTQEIPWFNSRNWRKFGNCSKGRQWHQHIKKKHLGSFLIKKKFQNKKKFWLFRKGITKRRKKEEKFAICDLRKFFSNTNLANKRIRLKKKKIKRRLNFINNTVKKKTVFRFIKATKAVYRISKRIGIYFNKKKRLAIRHKKKSKKKTNFKLLSNQRILKKSKKKIKRRINRKVISRFKRGVYYSGFKNILSLSILKKVWKLNQLNGAKNQFFNNVTLGFFLFFNNQRFFFSNFFFKFLNFSNNFVIGGNTIINFFSVFFSVFKKFSVLKNNSIFSYPSFNITGGLFTNNFNSIFYYNYFINRFNLRSIGLRSFKKNIHIFNLKTWIAFAMKRFFFKTRFKNYYKLSSRSFLLNSGDLIAGVNTKKKKNLIENNKNNLNMLNYRFKLPVTSFRTFKKFIKRRKFFKLFYSEINKKKKVNISKLKKKIKLWLINRRSGRFARRRRRLKFRKKNLLVLNRFFYFRKLSFSNGLIFNRTFKKINKLFTNFLALKKKKNQKNAKRRGKIYRNQKRKYRPLKKTKKPKKHLQFKPINNIFSNKKKRNFIVAKRLAYYDFFFNHLSFFNYARLYGYYLSSNHISKLFNSSIRKSPIFLLKELLAIKKKFFDNFSLANNSEFFVDYILKRKSRWAGSSLLRKFKLAGLIKTDFISEKSMYKIFFNELIKNIEVPLWKRLSDSRLVGCFFNVSTTGTRYSEKSLTHVRNQVFELLKFFTYKNLKAKNDRLNLSLNFNSGVTTNSIVSFPKKMLGKTHKSVLIKKKKSELFLYSKFNEARVRTLYFQTDFIRRLFIYKIKKGKKGVAEKLLFNSIDFFRKKYWKKIKSVLLKNKSKVGGLVLKRRFILPFINVLKIFRAKIFSSVNTRPYNYYGNLLILTKQPRPWIDNKQFALVKFFYGCVKHDLGRDFSRRFARELYTLCFKPHKSYFIKHKIGFYKNVYKLSWRSFRKSSRGSKKQPLFLWERDF